MKAEDPGSARHTQTLQTEKTSPVTLVFFGYNALWLQQLNEIQLSGNVSSLV